MALILNGVRGSQFMKTHYRLEGTGGSTQCGLKFKFNRYGTGRSFQATYTAHKVSCLRCLKLMKLERLSDVDLVNVNVNTLRGASLGAIHWYVELQSDDENGDLKVVELSHPLTEANILELNKADEFLRPYREGDMYSGFWSPESAKQAGIEQWRDIFPKGRFLVEGRHYYIEPKIVAATIYEDDGDLKAAAAKIVEDCEAIGWFDNPKNDTLMDQYMLQWEMLLREVIDGETVHNPEAVS